MSGNQTIGHPCDAARQWRMFDALTLRLRALIAAAPCRFDVAAAWRDYRLRGERAAAAAFVAYALRRRDELIAKTYGADHPQIGARTPEKRAGGRPAKPAGEARRTRGTDP